MKKNNRKSGGAILLKEEHFNTKNRWGHPVVGWLKNSDGVGGLHNPRGFAISRIITQKLIDSAFE